MGSRFSTVGVAVLVPTGVLGDDEVVGFFCSVVQATTSKTVTAKDTQTMRDNKMGTPCGIG